MNRHQFQQAAKHFRAGRLTLENFTSQVFATDRDTKESGRAKTAVDGLPSRDPKAHKGDFGRILVVGGSAGMAGAPALSGLAALKSGSGLVAVAVPENIQAIVASFSPCYMTHGLSESKGKTAKEAIDDLADKCEWADVVVMGPGLGRSKSLQKIVSLLYTQLPQPMVLDADAINNLADAGTDLKNHEGLRILTPHPGEFQRLDGLADTTDREVMEKRAKEISAESNLTIVLKGHRTLVTNGNDSYHNETGNAGMATAGAGDVLTGVVSSLLGQGLKPFDACCEAVRIHGLAGDFGAKELGEVSLTASDILDYLPPAFRAKKK